MTASRSATATIATLVALLVPLRDSLHNGAEASGGGVMTIAASLPSANDGLHTRRIVPLIRTGSLLAGRSPEGTVRLVTIDHPALRECRMVIRESFAGDGSTTIRLSVPDEPPGAPVRATIFVEPGSGKRLLEERRATGRVLHEPGVLRASGPDGKDIDFHFYRVATIGTYRLLAVPSHGLPFGRQEKNRERGRADAGDIVFGLSTVGFSIILLVVAQGFSRTRHAAERRSEGA